jgi:hypothetical protein
VRRPVRRSPSAARNFDGVENVYIGTYKVIKYSARTSTEIVCQVPASAAAGTYNLTLVGFDGTRYDGGKFEVIPAEINILAAA